MGKDSPRSRKRQKRRPKSKNLSGFAVNILIFYQPAPPQAERTGGKIAKARLRVCF
jgi:hypothetical protein